MPTNLEVNIGGPIPTDAVFRIEVDQTLDVPDMCTVEIANIDGEYSNRVKEGDPLKVTASGATLFDGEVLGIEPQYNHNMPARVTVRGITKMHRLARGRKSRTFEKMTDQDMVQKVASEAGLSAQCDSDPKIKHDHVYQHNQTDLEFILQRAKRIDYMVNVEGTTLNFKKRKADGPVEKLKWGGGDGKVERFRPRQSAANQVNKVTVRGWDPIKKKEIVATVSAKAEYGGTSGADIAAKAFGQVELIETDRPVHSQEEAQAVANTILRERQMSFLSGEALLAGSPTIKAGVTIELDVNDPKFNGKYYVKACVHRYVHSVGGVDGVAHREAGYRTLVKVQKDSEG